MKKTLCLLLLTLSVLLISCSDTYNDPILLADQKALSEVYKERPLYSSFYYEGAYKHEGNSVHVFALKIISKFHSAKHFKLYYLPIDEIEIKTDVGDYKGTEFIKLTHRFSYRHDDGVFALSGKKRLLETIEANFTEEYSYLEDRCIKAKKRAANNSRSYPQVKYAAEICYTSANFEESKAFALKLKENIDAFDRYTTKGQMLHDYHTLIGRHALREGAKDEAKRHLLLSLEVSPSPVMMSFGPNMELASDLLKQGEKATVLRYLDGCAKFWKDEPIQLWKMKINENKIPALNIYAWEREARQNNTTSNCYYDYKRKHYKKAFNSCLDEASHGDPGAQFNMGHLYRTGKAGTKDKKKAVEYYQLAADQDYGEAQFSLGIMHYQGSGTAVDMEKARYWWEKAESNGISPVRVQKALKRMPKDK